MNHKKLCYLPQQQSKYAVLQFHSLGEEAQHFFFFIFMKLGGKVGNKDRIKNDQEL